MHHQLPPLKRLTVLALAGLLTAGSLGSVLASQACQHQAMHHAMQHGAADRPCWCDQMTGGGTSEQPVVEALPPVTTVVVSLLPYAVVPLAATVPAPESPSFAPTPPPPNGRPS